MNTTVKSIALIAIAIGLFLGVRYLSSIIHYACLNPAEDCPPPFRLVADLGFFVTGGSLNPLWVQNAPYDN
jgi:hypothetical protein